ncbi:MAG: ornithine cyclodeaminase family protein [Planctomycetota bacterium]
MKTLILTRADLEKLLTMEMALSAVEHAFAVHGRGEALMPPKVYLPLPQHAGDFRAMPSYMEGSAGVKWVNSHPENPKRHELPAVLGVYVLSDAVTAAPLAVMDGTLLTAFRTGAAAGVASKLLGARPPRSLGLVGCGVQARVLLAAHRAMYEVPLVLAADASREAAERFARETGARVATVEEAAGCDIVCTTTPSRSPVVRRAWVRSGAHINAIGADAPGKQELEAQVLKDARVFLDDMAQATESGEVNVPLHRGEYRREQIEGTLGEVVVGKKPGRRGDEITVFDSTGLAVQDLSLARVVYQEACRRGVGLATDLVG